VVLTDWPPGPEEQKVSTRNFRFNLDIDFVGFGRTATVAAEVWNAALRFPWRERAERECTPLSYFSWNKLLALNRGDAS